MSSSHVKILMEENFLADTEREVCRLGYFATILPSVTGRVFLETDEELAAFPDSPDPRCHRHLCRASLIGLKHFSSLQTLLAKRDIPRERVGLYYAGNLGALDWKSMGSIAHAVPEELSAVMMRDVPRKQFLKSGAVAAASQLAVFLGISGPVYSFLHPVSAKDALWAQAEFDLNQRIVDLAIILLATSLENPLENLYVHQQSSSILAESSFCAVATRKDFPAVQG